MPLLKDILYRVHLKAVSGDNHTEVKDLCFDSRKVQEGSLFIAVRGTQTDGHDFIEVAVQKGAVAVVCERMPSNISAHISYVMVEDSAEALGHIASNFYHNPAAKLKVVAVTGTNGKTTTVTLLHQLFRKLGYGVGMLTTIHNKINEKEIPATHTTPDAIQLNQLLAQMVDEGCTYCFMEASSHAIVQKRIAGLELAGAAFMNISHDHLDYHKTFDEYIRAKKRLFDQLGAVAFALSNIDDKRGRVMLQNTRALKKTFSLKKVADFRGKLIANTLNGLELEIEHSNIWFKLIGGFNAYNLLAAYAVARLLEEEHEEILTHLSGLSAIPGRFECIPNQANITAIVDYAHTPDALENVLATISNFRTGNETLITVVGCGGDRDKEKRPYMAEVACIYSDKVILTSDNPRSEDPEAIIKDMQKGVRPANYKKTLVIADRKEAIKTACMLSQSGDIILVAGKGHEAYQEIKGVRYDFDDRKVLKETLLLMLK